MIDTMDAMPGYGLAAVQIGVSLRLAVVDCSEARGQAVRMANPEILHASGQVRIDQLDHFGIYNQDTQRYSHQLRLITRVLS